MPTNEYAGELAKAWTVYGHIGTYQAFAKYTHSVIGNTYADSYS